ncbi:MAG: NAD-dependent succinate-semialdehyde dehydrogenase [Deinococcota bacterium]
MSTTSTLNFQQLIHGEWTNAANGGTWDLINPATEAVIQAVPFGDATDASQALDAASAALPAWADKTPHARGELLIAAANWILERLDALAVITTEESGKPLGEARTEWRNATNYLKWFAAEACRAYGRTIPARTPGRRIEVRYQPVGVVGTITAWNFPVYNVVRCWAAALAAGCTVVGRPSEYTPRSAMAVAQALTASGAPVGVINLINGDPASMAGVMLADPRCRKISFTGSIRVGKLLMEGAAKTVTKLSLELGGNAPVLVFPDAGKVSQLAHHAVTRKYYNAGQVCIAPQRFYVHESIADEFTETSARLSAGLTVGNGQDRNTDVGPLINATQRERISNLVSSTANAGADVLIGGRPVEGRGYFYTPTVLAGVNADMPLHREEAFGPVMSMTSFSDVDEALALANDTEYGLAAYVFTQNLNIANRMADKLEYGLISINNESPAAPEAPFGGVKQSGIGRETGSEGLFEYLEPKTVFTGNLS